MSYTAIRVENLSKRYRIMERQPYKTLCDAVMRFLVGDDCLAVEGAVAFTVSWLL